VNLEILRVMLNKAVKWGMLDENPFNKLKDPNGKTSIFYQENNDRIRCLGEDEIQRLLEVSPPYLRNIIKGAIFTGLRKGDLLSLKWTDVDLERGSIAFREQKKETS
jgi:integrase